MVFIGDQRVRRMPRLPISRRGAILTEQALVDRSNKSISGFRSRLAGWVALRYHYWACGFAVELGR